MNNWLEMITIGLDDIRNLTCDNCIAYTDNNMQYLETPSDIEKGLFNLNL